MADRNDRDQQRGNGGDQSGDDQSRLDRSLERGRDDLAGDIDSNRNLSGSSTYDTLHEQGDLDVVSGDSTQDGGRDRGSSGQR